jgi:hypothetical protein
MQREGPVLSRRVAPLSGFHLSRRNRIVKLELRRLKLWVLTSALDDDATQLYLHTKVQHL